MRLITYTQDKVGFGDDSKIFFSMLNKTIPWVPCLNRLCETALMRCLNICFKRNIDLSAALNIYTEKKNRRTNTWSGCLQKRTY